MERNPLSDVSSQEAKRPPRYRLSWDSRGLVLEERQPDQSFVVRASSAITFPPTPLAATHPELGKIVDRTIVQFMRGWLHGVEKIAVAFSPPWGNAWKIPIGTLSGEDVREHVEWELQQRLKDSLQSNIFAWNRVNGDAYAVVIRPELLSFWEEMLKNRGLELCCVNITSGLVDPQMEEEADLLPLLHLWQNKGEPEGVEEDHSIRVQYPFADSDEVLEADIDSDDDRDAKLETDALSQNLSDDELDDVDFTPLRPRGQGRFLPWIIGAVALVVVAVSLWFFRDPLLSMLQSPQDTIPADQMAESIPAEADVSGDMAVMESSQPAAVQGSTQQRAGFVLDRLFAQAAAQNVNLSAVILQGRELLFEASGDAASLNSWKAAAFSGLSMMPRQHDSRGGSFQLDSVMLPDIPETQLTVTEFDLLASDAGLTVMGPELYTANQAALTSLFARMTEAGKRPWRLSVHKSGADTYHVMMMP